MLARHFVIINKSGRGVIKLKPRLSELFTASRSYRKSRETRIPVTRCKRSQLQAESNYKHNKLRVAMCIINILILQ